jgi:acyl carrier protein
MQNTDQIPNSRTAILDAVIGATQQVTEGWDHEFAGPLGPDTRLVADLGCQSLDIVVLAGRLSRELQRNNIPFDRLLLSGGKPVQDLSLGTLADFLYEQTRNRGGIASHVGWTAT